MLTVSDQVSKEDAKAVSGAKGGDRQAFELLVGRHCGRILSVAQRITRNREDAEDVAQQTFQKAFVNLRSFEGRSSFITWLTQIATNEARMLLRRKRSSPEVLIVESIVNNETAPRLDFFDLSPSPEESCLQRERARFLFAAINKLKPQLRTVIELRELRELSTKETAGMMGISVVAAKVSLFRGRRKLRQMLTARSAELRLP